MTRLSRTSTRNSRAWLLLGLLASQGCASNTVNPPARTPTSEPSAGSRAQRYLAEGLRFARAGDLVRAEQYLASAWRSDGQDLRILRALLHVCIAASRLGAAATYARAHLLTHPHAWQLRYVLVSVELALTRTDEAKQELRHVVEDAPDHAEAYYLLATLAPDARAPSAATRELYDHYLALAPNGPHAYEARSFLRMQPEPEAER